MGARVVLCAALLAACSPAAVSAVPVRSIDVATVAPPKLEPTTVPAPAAEMPEPAPPRTHGFWWDHDVPGRAYVIGRYRFERGAMPVVEADGGVRVRLVIHDDCPFPEAVFVRVHGQAQLDPASGDVPTYIMDVRSDGFETVYWSADVRNLEEVHAAVIDAALGELRRRKKTIDAAIAIEQAAVVLDQRLEGHCDAVARCRDEVALAAQVRAGAVDLRTLAAVLKSYRDDPLSLRH